MNWLDELKDLKFFDDEEEGLEFFPPVFTDGKSVQQTHTPKITTRERFARHGVGFRRKTQKAVKLGKPDIELNEQNRRALDLLENSNHNIFITGKAGSGKSTLLKYFRATTKKNIAVVAPTGIAAINVQGQTIHRFFKMTPQTQPHTVKRYLGKGARLYKSLAMVVIDEISMVRADVMDCVDAFLRLHGPKPGQPFGGVRLVAFGDLYQLPPVLTEKEAEFFMQKYTTPFFFSAHSFQKENITFTAVELTKVYRQSNPEFISALNAVREGDLTEQHLELFNSRVNPSEDVLHQDSHMRIWLVSTNDQAAEINGSHLERLQAKEKVYTGDIEGDFEEKDLPTALDLKVKVGAQVMLLNNDPQRRWVNGDLAKVVDLGSDYIRVMFDDRTFEDVKRHTWESYTFELDESTGKIETVVSGSFTQFPLKPAWAITIHKSQGKTYEHAVVDFGHRAFAPGQAYVALSRCRTLEGLVLKRPLRRSDVLVDAYAKEFMTLVSKLSEEKFIPKR